MTNYNCVKISGDNYRVYCERYSGRDMNLIAAKRAVIALLNERDDYFDLIDGRSWFDHESGKIEYYHSVNGEVRMDKDAHI